MDAQVNQWSTHIPPFFGARPLSDRLGGRADLRESSRSSRSRQLGATPIEGDEAESSAPQSSVVSSVVVVDNKKTERPGEASRAGYLERVKDVDLEDLACRRHVVGGDSGAQEGVARGLEQASLCGLAKGPRRAFLDGQDTRDRRTGIPKKSIMGPVNYRPLKQLGSPGLIVKLLKHRTSIARTRVAIPAQLRLVQ